MTEIHKIREAYAQNLRSVQALVDFDRTVLEAALSLIRRLKADCEDRPSIANRIANTLQMLENVRDNDSMRANYVTIYNQSVVLLVSHLASALHSLFVAAAPNRIGVTGEKDALKEEIKFNISATFSRFRLESVHRGAFGEKKGR